MSRHIITPKGDVVLVLSGAEARALHIAGSEGHALALGDGDAARLRYGGQSSIDAAARAVEVLAEVRADLPRRREQSK
jgi:hypothetical protein